MPEHARIAAPELARLIHAREPTAFLVYPRVLRRVIKYDQRVSGFGLHVPHGQLYLIDRGPLLKLVEVTELQPEPHRPLPARITLLAEPDPEELELQSRPELLFNYWRLLFHALVHRTFEERLATNRLTPAGVRERVHRIGQTEFDEIRSVLHSEERLLPRVDSAGVYVEFAAVYLELRIFDPERLPCYFPAIGRFETVDEILALDVNAEELFEQARLPGAPDPPEEGMTTQVTVAPPIAPIQTPGSSRRMSSRRSALLARAGRKRAVGNHMRAAVLSLRAAQLADPSASAHELREADNDLRAFLTRLAKALDIDAGALSEWRSLLLLLLPHTATAPWGSEARLLYDLQKVCIDFESEVFVIDAVEWVLSFFKRPLRRELPNQHEVRMAKHLRSALGRVHSVNLHGVERRRLIELLEGALDRLENRMRRMFRPVLHAAFDEVELQPRNLPETVARRKLIEELLDHVTRRGYLTMGDLRDALSRNNLKLPDVETKKLLTERDILLRLDRELAVSLEGIYQRGEFYLRWLQKASSAAFGTNWGRFATVNLILPFGGSYIVLEGLQHLLAPLLERLGGIHVHLMNVYSWLAAGMFMLGMIHSRTFRQLILDGCRLVGRALRFLLYDGPRTLARLRLVRSIVESRAFLTFYQAVLKPMIWTWLVWLNLPHEGTNTRSLTLIVTVTFLTVSLFLNSPVGRELEEIFVDVMGRMWRRVRIGLFVGLYHFLVDVFHQFQDSIERVLYAIDEWFRFRKGEGTLSYIIKPVLGPVWYLINYLIRAVVNLLVEPQINPIKHFPVVTVAHKIILPLGIPISGWLEGPLGKAEARTVVFTTIWLIPGIFGFIVWEFKENWKLYRSNRSRHLRAVLIGEHGETMLRFMRPGFHSGTLPKLFARLRRAERKAARLGAPPASQKLELKLHHVVTSLRNFVDRELIMLLTQCSKWTLPIETGEIEVGSNRIRTELVCADYPERSVVICFEEQSGWLLASMPEAGWLRDIDDDHRTTFTCALAGLYKLAGVDLVREQIQACLGPEPTPFDIDRQFLVAWPQSNYDAEVAYNLQHKHTLTPRVISGQAPASMPEFTPNDLLFRNIEITWSDWVRCWDRESPSSREQLLRTVRHRLLSC